MRSKQVYRIESGAIWLQLVIMEAILYGKQLVMNGPQSKDPPAGASSNHGQAVHLLLGAPAKMKLLEQGRPRLFIFMRSVSSVRCHPSIIRDWGINE